MMTAKAIAKRLEPVGYLASEARDLLQTLVEELQEEFDEKTEKWREGEKGQAWQDALYELEERIGDLENCERITVEVP